MPRCKKEPRMLITVLLTHNKTPAFAEVLCVAYAGWENRTPAHSLENCYSTIKLIPRLKLILSTNWKYSVHTALILYVGKLSILSRN